MKTQIPYYVQYIAADGITHYAVHYWNRLTGFVTAMRDHVFKEA